MLAHISCNGQSLAPKHLLDHSGDLSICTCMANTNSLMTSYFISHLHWYTTVPTWNTTLGGKKYIIWKLAYDRTKGFYPKSGVSEKLKKKETDENIDNSVRGVVCSP